MGGRTLKRDAIALMRLSKPLSTRTFSGKYYSLLLSGRVIHLDGDSLILEPHSSGHHVPLSYCALRN
jgi:hypothetical protein